MAICVVRPCDGKFTAEFEPCGEHAIYRTHFFIQRSVLISGSAASIGRQTQAFKQSSILRITAILIIHNLCMNTCPIDFILLQV